MTDRIGGRLPARTVEQLERLFRRYNARLLRVAVGATRDRQAGEDVAQETWLAAAESLPARVDDDEAFAWLAASARRRAIKLNNRPDATGPRDWSDAVASRALPSVASAEDEALAGSSLGLSPEATAAVASLSPDQRDVILMRGEGLTYSAIAARTGVPESRVFLSAQAAAARLRTAGMWGGEAA